MTKLLQLLGWYCRHNHRSRSFKDDIGNYVRCLDCGRRIEHELPEPIRMRQALPA